METRSIFVLLVLLFAAGVLADAYTWTDEDGVIHFSDREHPGAEKIELDVFETPQQPPTYALPARRDTKDDVDRQPKYTVLEILNPGAEETLWNIETVLNVDMDLQPSLMPGHQVRVFYDGMPRLVSSTNIQVREVYRGMHSMKAEVVDGAGKVLIQSPPVRFYVQQNSAQ
jgi:hypothetical protein